MLVHSLHLLLAAAVVRCQTIVFDGRVSAVAKAADFDGTDSPFDPENTKGQGEHNFASIYPYADYGQMLASASWSYSPAMHLWYGE
jgi:hypothetical protein